MKTKKEIQKELEKFETFFLAHRFAEDCEGSEMINSDQYKFLSEWISKNCGKWDSDSCGDRILSFQWVLECQQKLPGFLGWQLIEFVETLKAKEKPL